MIDIALIEPEIPQNCGNVARLSVALGVELHLVGPLGFRLDEKSVRRAAMDYWKDARVRVHESRSAFAAATAGRRLVGVDPRGEARYDRFEWLDGDILCFGSEGSGLAVVPRPSVYIPMRENCRSINLANAVAIVAYEANRSMPGLVRPPPAPAWGGGLEG